ncbi:MAG: TIM-barrel domain-containing protein, partial [Acidobacteriota bacterium]
AELRGGLSFGLSGFTYWSHDVGGFVDRSPRDLYRRWMAFGVLSSHTRAHGAPPREPWEYDQAMTEDFRRALNMRYALMPYIYSQAVDSSAKGFPMLRTLFFEFPDDPTSWLIEDEYMFGSNLLVGPLFEEGKDSRKMYLPPGKWIDYQTGQVYDGERWHSIASGAIPAIILVRDHSVLPQVKPAQSTSEIDWKNIELRVFSTDNSPVSGVLAFPGKSLKTIELIHRINSYTLKDDIMEGKVNWQITGFKSN